MTTTDITHTTKPSERPHPEARLLKNLRTGVAEWVVPEVEVPEFLKPVKPRTKKTK